MNYGTHVRDLLVELKRSEEAMVTANGGGGGGSGGTQQDVGKLATVAIPSYNDQSVRAALQDFTLHVQALQEQAEATHAAASAAATASGRSIGATKPSLAVRPSIVLQNAACQRNKRGLLLYHIIRMQRIQDLLYWQSGVGSTGNIMNQATAITMNENYNDGNGTTNGGTDSDAVLQNLCPSEKDFLYKYQQLISNYMQEQELPNLSIIDLRAHCTVPPITVDRVVCRVIDTTPFATTNDTGIMNDDDVPDQQSNTNTIVLESGQCVNFTIGSTHYLIYSDCEEYIRCGALQMVESEEI